MTYHSRPSRPSLPPALVKVEVMPNESNTPERWQQRRTYSDSSTQTVPVRYSHYSAMDEKLYYAGYRAGIATYRARYKSPPIHVSEADQFLCSLAPPIDDVLCPEPSF